VANPIPNEWRKKVLGALRNGNFLISPNALSRFNDCFPEAFEYDCIDALIGALGNENIRGCQFQSNTGQGEIWEFLFTRKGLPMYGKIEMQLSGKTKIWSAHSDDKRGILSCD
jgi:hypothetical protein